MGVARTARRTGFCVTVHVFACLLLHAAVSRSGYPGVDRIQDGREAAWKERLWGYISGVMKARRKKEERGANTACRVSTACVIFPIIARDAHHNRQLLHRDCHSAVALPRPFASLSCSRVNVLFPFSFFFSSLSMTICEVAYAKSHTHTRVERNPLEWIPRNCYVCFSLCDQASRKFFDFMKFKTFYS